MKIQLKSDAHPLKKRPYRIHPMYNEKVKQDIDRILKVGILFPSEWISPMVI